MFRVTETNTHRWLIPLLSAGALFAIVFFVFPYNSGDSSIKSPLGISLWSTWTATGPEAPDYSYCIYVPLMVAYLLFEARKKVVRTPVRGRVSAVVWIVIGLVLFWLGSRAGKQYVGCAGVQLLTLGVIYWFWGGRVFRNLLFIWAILCFAWPLPFLDSVVAFPMRMIVCDLSYYALNLVGIPSIQSGTALLSAPNPAAGLALGAKFQIDIKNPCSGLHSLMPLLMFSSFYSYFFLHKRWHQWTAFLSAIPFTIIGNVIRIMMLVIGCLTLGTDVAIGTNDIPSTFHEGCGYTVFVVVLGMECILGFLLVRFDRRKSAKSVSASKSNPSVQPLTEEENASLGEVPAWRSGVMVGFAAVMLVIFWMTPPLYLPAQPGVVMDLPTQITLPEAPASPFYGETTPVTDSERTILPKDTEFTRKNYDDKEDHQVFVSIVLSGNQQYTVHAPEVCIVAQGWNIIGQDDVPIQLNSGHKLVVRNLTIQREAVDMNQKHFLVKAYYMYWYVADELTTPSHTERNWLTTWDRVVHNQDHRWAYVIAMSLVTGSIHPHGMDANQTRDMLTNFIKHIVPTFQKNEMSGYAANN